MGRGYSFVDKSHVAQEQYVKGIMGSRYNGHEFANPVTKYHDRNLFLGYVWSNRFEIGANLTAAEKEQFPDWIRWEPEVNSNDPLAIKTLDNVTIGHMVLDDQNRIVPRYLSGAAAEIVYNQKIAGGYSSLS